MSLRGEETGIHGALRGKPQAGTGTAERLRHGRNHADLAAAIPVAPAFGHFARIVCIDGFQRHGDGYAAHDFGGRNHIVHTPAVGGAHIHVFDEADDVAAALEVACHVDDAVVVDAALHHHVDLYRREADTSGFFDAIQYLGDREVHVVHGAENGVVERIQADGHAGEPGILQRLRLRGQRRTVGGEGEIETGDAGQFLDELFHMTAHQRFAAGEADFFDAVVLAENPRQPLYFLEGEQLVVGEKFVVTVEYFLGHAVHAAEVAAIGHGDAQVVHRAAQPVTHACAGNARRCGAGNAFSRPLIDDRDDATGHVGATPLRAEIRPMQSIRIIRQVLHNDTA